MSKHSNPYGQIPYRTSDEVRQSFLDFFAGKDHKIVASAPSFPADDPTILFTNAGMNPFKSIFLGDNPKGLKRVADTQKCIRVSGKHNDLDEVGRDTYHQTFFEMLGCWSFGDYYKKEIIRWSWELLTEVWGLPKERLFVTVYTTDDEAEQLWASETDIEPSRILRFEKDNFWEMGEVGPCGPCSEIHFDLGDLASQKETYSDPVRGVNGENDRYIEIWNLVFMQSQRLKSGDLKPLVHKHIDTGMGFERVVSIIQGTGSNYKTDVFSPLLNAIAEASGKGYGDGPEGLPHRVIADHLRTLCFAIADGATPSNEGRGYVLRRVLRRASRFAQELGQKEPFIFTFVDTLAKQFGTQFPELNERKDYIKQVIRDEEERFSKTLHSGLQLFEKTIASLGAPKGAQTVFPGKDAFTLFDTYGFPYDLTEMLAEERGFSVDQKAYDTCMQEQRERARGQQKSFVDVSTDEGWAVLKPGLRSNFTGYERLAQEDISTLRYQQAGDTLWLVLEDTPFYAESGGQVGDRGRLYNEDVELEVLDTTKTLDVILHRCRMTRGLANEQTLAKLSAEVDPKLRAETTRHHSATHLLHAALRAELGEHVQQQGSMVGPEGLRFDFTHNKALDNETLRRIEGVVNDCILANTETQNRIEDLETAKAQGALALFGEKYEDQVRVVQMGEFSTELCGGTHVNATGSIGYFRIVQESSIAAGIRRVEAICGQQAVRAAQQDQTQVQALAQAMKTQSDEVFPRYQEMVSKLRHAEKALSQLHADQRRAQLKAMIAEQAEDFGGVPVWLTALDAKQFPKDSLQQVLDETLSQLEGGVGVMTHVEDGQLSILGCVSKKHHKQLKAGLMIKELASLAGGKGGGRPDKARAGSKSVERAPDVLKRAREMVQAALADPAAT